VEPLLKSKAVCEFLDLSLATLSRLCSSGDIPHIILRRGRRKRIIRFRLEELERWLCSRSRGEPGRSIRKGRRNGDEMATQNSAISELSENKGENGEGHRSVSPVSGA